MDERIVNLYKAKSSLSELVDRAAAGEEIIIAKAGKPMAKLVPLEPNKQTRTPGLWKGRVIIGKHFDAPLPRALQRAFAGHAK